MATAARQLTKRRRLVLVTGIVSVVAAVAIVIAGATLGRFSATKAETNQLSAGAVTLTISGAATCTMSGLLPGQSPAPCTLQATYTGSVPAYLGLDVLIATKSGAPGSDPLYKPSDSSNDLQITIKDNQTANVTYVTPSTSFGTALASCPAGSGFGASYTCYQLNDLLVSTTAFTSSSAADTFTTSVTLPTTSATTYQGGVASIELTVHGVQSAHQTLGSCTAGAPCGIGWG